MKPALIRSLLKRLSFVMVTTLVAFLVVELTLRLFSPRYYPVTPAAYEYDSDTAYRLRPNSHLLTTTDFQQETIANSLGSANFQQNFDGYESLVFAVRDSYTQGLGVPADMSYPAHCLRQVASCCRGVDRWHSGGRLLYEKCRPDGYGERA